MPGIGLVRNTFWHHFMLNIDRLFAILSIALIFNYQACLEYWLLIACALLCMTLSETVFRQEKWSYMVLHSAWHIQAFHLAFVISVY